jgi:hypothetical protein
MSRLVTLALLSCLLTRVSCLISFINPPPFGTGGDFSGNPTYGVGSIVNIAWQGGEDGVGVSIVLYQLNQTNGQWFGDMEYLTRKHSDVPVVRLFCADEHEKRTHWVPQGTRGSWVQGKTWKFPTSST